MNTTAKSELQKIPGVGTSIARDLKNIGINSIADLKGKDSKHFTLNPISLRA